MAPIARLAVCTLLALAACMSADAQSCDPAEIGFTPSRLGLDYKGAYPQPLAEILSQGEAERIESLAAEFSALGAPAREAVQDEWRAVLDGLFSGTLSGSFDGGSTLSFDLLRAAAPDDAGAAQDLRTGGG